MTGNTMNILLNNIPITPKTIKSPKPQKMKSKGPSVEEQAQWFMKYYFQPSMDIDYSKKSNKLG